MPTPRPRCMKRPFSGSWLEDQHQRLGLPAGQRPVNSLQEKADRSLRRAARAVWLQLLLWPAPLAVEDRGTVQYLQDCAAEAGLATESPR